nr:MAG TPA: hypothetical protein [Caudoviricetes sp.]
MLRGKEPSGRKERKKRKRRSRRRARKRGETLYD